MQRVNELPTLCIGCGLVPLLAANFWPAVPVVSAAALVGLGACASISSRWSTRPWAVAAHLMLYVGLVALFAGARFHATMVDESAWRMVDALDFYVAAGLVALTISATVRGLTVEQA